MIDVSKVKVGDELEFRCKVVNIDPGDDFPFRLEFPDGRFEWFKADCFARHIPAPRPFENGDKVTWGIGMSGEIRALADGIALIRTSGGLYMPVGIGELHYADTAPEDEIVVTDEEAIRAYNIYCRGPIATNMRAALVDFLTRRKEASR